MLHSAPTYVALTDAFEWKIPREYNIAADVCDKWAASAPEQTAILDCASPEVVPVSFAELNSLASALAQHLQSIGVRRGDRVGVFRGQSVWTAAAHIAVWKLGAISVPLFYLFGPDALQVRLSNSAARAVITDALGAQTLAELNAGLPDLETVIVPETLILPEKTADFPAAITNADDPAVIIYTSGTTGAPKGALLPHRTLLGHLPGVEMSHNFLPQQGDVMWTPADWAWIGGLFDVLMPALHHGIPVVAGRLPKFSPDACIDLIQRAGVRNVFFPPTALKALMAEGVRIEGLRSVASGGEPLGEELRNWGRSHLGVEINEFYGQTECNMVVSSCSALFQTPTGCIGRPVVGHRVAVIDAHGNPTQTEGDIAVHRDSPVAMLRYWDNPRATAQKYRGDWLVMGDRGIMRDGCVQFVGRDDDVITSSGYRIGPAEIEDCLLAHSAVSAAAVVGKPDAKRTEIVKAFVVLANSAQQGPEMVSILQSHVKGRLAAHEYPREIEFVETLPMTITGKIIRKELKARAAAEI